MKHGASPWIAIHGLRMEAGCSFNFNKLLLFTRDPFARGAIDLFRFYRAVTVRGWRMWYTFL